MLLLPRQRNMHRRDLPCDHLCQRRTDRLLAAGWQLPPQLIQPQNRQTFWT
jgi:hypothetical protein